MQEISIESHRRNRCRAKPFSYSAGALAPPFEGTEKVLSLDSQPAYARSVSKP
jgi:hypothetical protein